MADTQQVDTEQSGAKGGWAGRWDAYEVTQIGRAHV